jgi:hypothetical protein
VPVGSDQPSGTIPVLLKKGLRGKPEGSVVGAGREPRSSLEPVMFDVIERLKSEWTDKYVVVSSPAPELARFSRTTGVVKTVNMNGRCLVEFDQFNNTGWYDIDPACLTIVAKPEPKPAAAKETKAPPAAKAPAAPKPAAPKPAAADKPAAKPAAAGKPSTADILAAARAKAAGGATPAAAAKPAGGKPSTADILAAARAKGGAPAAKPAGDEGAKADPGTKPSTAEILARARAAKAATPPAPEAAEEPIESVAAAPVAKPAATAKPAAGGALPTTTAEKLAWCRAHDAQG